MRAFQAGQRSSHRPTNWLIRSLDLVPVITILSSPAPLAAAHAVPIYLPASNGFTVLSTSANSTGPSMRSTIVPCRSMMNVAGRAANSP